MTSTTRKLQLLQKLNELSAAASPYKEELDEILKAEEEERQGKIRYVYLIVAKYYNNGTNMSYTKVDAAYDTLKEAEANLPPTRYSGNRRVDFKIDRVKIGNKSKEEILAGYYSD